MIQAIRGTKDILPSSSPYWQFAEYIFRTISRRYGFEELRTPIFEKTELFSRSVGEETDIVNKEMYTFEDRGKESITLRPEGTAPIVRSIIENSLLNQSQTLKLWYCGPYFRYERPQKGRLRQFHQYGAECIGASTPESDAETILLAVSVIRELGIDNFKLLLNSLGNDDSRTAYKNALLKYLTDHQNDLSDDSKRRLESNPLRILDSKDTNDIQIVENAPLILDYLDQESNSHFQKLKYFLDNANIEYQISPKLVRGLDYYNHTVFEFQHSALGAQNSFGGGGRYNDLFNQLGGKETPAIGFALGIERLLLIMESIDSLPSIDMRPDAFIVTTSPDLFVHTQYIAQQLRFCGYNINIDLQQRSVKAQFREANKQNAKYTIIIGKNEIINNNVIVKNMSDGSQYEISISDLIEYDFS